MSTQHTVEKVGASLSAVVVRCGRAQAKTHVCHATTSPGWFKEMIMQVELPLMPRPKRRGKRRTFDGDGDDEEEDENSEGSGSEGTESDVENGGGMSMRQASASGVRPGGGGGGVVGFDGVAWWAAPAVSVVVLDEDVGRDDVLGTAEVPVDLAGVVQRL